MTEGGIGRLFSLAYRDAVRVLREMWLNVVIILVILVATSLVGGLAVGFVGTGLGRGIVDMLVSAAAAWVAAPYLMAIYRFVATNDRGDHPESFRNSPAAQRFAAWSVLTIFLASIPTLAMTLTNPVSYVGEEPVFDGPASLFVLALLLALWIFSVRAVTLLPGLVLDPATTTLGTALADSRGRFWFTVGALLLTILPVVLAQMLLIAFLVAASPPLAALLSMPIGLAFSGLALVLAISISTRLYQRFSARR